MRRLLAVLFTLGLLAAGSVAGQAKRESIQGVWRVVQVTITGPSGRTIRRIQPNLIIFTTSHYSRVEDHAEGRRPILTDVTTASADELRAAWGPFFGEAGTYDLSAGSLLTMRPIVAKNPVAQASQLFSTYAFKLEGDTLVVTQQRDQNGPVANPVTVKAIRAE